MPRTVARLRENPRGVTVIEFALLMPLFMVLLYGIMGYGEYFFFSHSLQEIANDAARATIAGLSVDERRTLAQGAVTGELAAFHQINPALVTTQVLEGPNMVTVVVRFDAKQVPLFKNTLIPMPDTMIERRGVVRPGGVA